LKFFFKYLCVLCLLCGFNSVAAAIDREAFTFTDYNLTAKIDPASTSCVPSGR